MWPLSSNGRKCKEEMPSPQVNLLDRELSLTVTFGDRLQKEDPSTQPRFLPFAPANIEHLFVGTLR